ncbi:sensor histidine kinase [Cohnella sp. GCM10027633]|uniref:sensor histidine kinase n=1 Tax=unclassified Cohnella TaxID=2636738 RepID=UPI00362FB705
MKRSTLRIQLIRGFLVIMVSMAAFLFYENYYAMKVVREEVSQSTSRVLSIQSAQIDQTLEDVSKYLLRQLLSNGSNNDLIALDAYPKEHGEYIYAKVRIQSAIVEGNSGFDNIHSIFAYAASKNDFVFSQTSYEQTENLRALLGEWIGSDTFAANTWQVIRDDRENYLVRADRAPSGAAVYIGAIIRLNDLLTSLHKLDNGEQWDAILLDREGQTLTNSAMPQETMLAINRKLLTNPLAYQVFKNPTDDKKYLLVSMPFRQAPLSLAAITPEKELLQQLPFFQFVIFLIPIVLVFIFYFYSLFMKRVLLSPLHGLIKAMRKVMDGEMEIQVKEAKTEEIYFLIQTFNRMVSQMKHLKINVYEEMLKAQQAEFKHLQAQINPHFYLNSLNIIYSLSILEENALIRKMTELLVDYFRFITRSHRDTVTIDEELAHIRNYLEIQKLRFPDKLTYSIRVPEPLRERVIFPLMIQPFIENAIIHGMEELDPFHIEIAIDYAVDGSGRIEVAIRDNGRGFAQHTLSAFNQLQFGDGTGGSNLGVWNVHRRLQVVFGDRFELAFGSHSPKGAIVVLRIPEQASETDNQGGVA